MNEFTNERMNDWKFRPLFAEFCSAKIHISKTICDNFSKCFVDKIETDRLSDWYGMSGQAQIWFSSYFKNRHQSIQIKDTLSDNVTLI